MAKVVIKLFGRGLGGYLTSLAAGPTNLGSKTSATMGPLPALTTSPPPLGCLACNVGPSAPPHMRGNYPTSLCSRTRGVRTGPGLGPR